MVNQPVKTRDIPDPAEVEAPVFGGLGIPAGSSADRLRAVEVEAQFAGRAVVADQDVVPVAVQSARGLGCEGVADVGVADEIQPQRAICLDPEEQALMNAKKFARTSGAISCVE